jgi:predicted nuclease with TOPRIM domain
MASPAPKSPAGIPNNEALDILRRLEAAIARITDELGDIKVEQKEQRRDIVKLQQDVARIDGRLSELSARVPTIWTIAALIFAIFGAAFVLIRFASGH